ncbi:hypothetical protein ACFQ0Q_50445 [Streptomyces aureus]
MTPWEGPGGAGGGSSDVRTCSSANPGCDLTGVPSTDPRLIVAGGGGGGGQGFSTLTNPEATGGNAGDTGQPGGDETGQRQGRRRRNPDIRRHKRSRMPTRRRYSRHPGHRRCRRHRRRNGIRRRRWRRRLVRRRRWRWLQRHRDASQVWARWRRRWVEPRPVGGTSGSAAGAAQVTITYDQAPATCATATPTITGTPATTS